MNRYQIDNAEEVVLVRLRVADYSALVRLEERDLFLPATEEDKVRRRES